MVSEHAVVFYPYDVVGVVLVIFFEVKEDFKLDTSLVLVLLIVPDNLDCHSLTCFVVVAFQCLTKATFA